MRINVYAEAKVKKAVEDKAAQMLAQAMAQQ